MHIKSNLHCRHSNYKKQKLSIHHLNMKRTNCISWDEYFIGVALLSAERSKDPTNHIGACIVNQQKRII